MELFGLTGLGLLGLWFSEMFFRILFAVIVVVFAFLNFEKSNFLRNTLIVLAAVLGLSVILFGVNFLIIIPKLIAGFFGSFMSIPGIFY